jgi:hypothetical protein
LRLESRRGPIAEPNWPDDATRRFPQENVPQGYNFRSLLSQGVYRVSSLLSVSSV